MLRDQSEISIMKLHRRKKTILADEKQTITFSPYFLFFAQRRGLYA